MSAVLSVAFSELINKPTGTIRQMVRARHLRLVRRDGDDLMLTSATTYEQQAEVTAAAAALFASLIRRPELHDILDALMVEAFPWTRFLPAGDLHEFAQELIDTLSAAQAIDNLTPVADLINQWKHTAEVRADPDLFAVLTSDTEGDYGPVPAPVRAG